LLSRIGVALKSLLLAISGGLVKVSARCLKAGHACEAAARI
jgi:hypothetical protein